VGRAVGSGAKWTVFPAAFKLRTIISRVIRGRVLPATVQEKILVYAIVISIVKLGFKNEAKTNPKYNFKA